MGLGRKGRRADLVTEQLVWGMLHDPQSSAEGFSLLFSAFSLPSVLFLVPFLSLPKASFPLSFQGNRVSEEQHILQTDELCPQGDCFFF